MTAGSLLERRYRAVLRLLPASYRAEREEEMVAEFMELSGDVPDEIGPRPPWGEIASVLALSLRVRLGGSRTRPRPYAWGETVRLVALLGLAHHAAFALFDLAALALATGGGEAAPPGAPGSPERLAAVVGTGLGALWPVAFAAAMLGRARLAKAAALLGLVPLAAYLVAAAVPPLAGDLVPPLAGDLVAPASGGLVAPAPGRVLLDLVPVLALLLGHHRDVTPARRPWWAVALPAVAAVALHAVLVPAAPWLGRLAGGHESWLYPWLAPAGLAAVALAAGAVACLVRRPPAAWPLALAGLGAVLVAAVLADALAHGGLAAAGPALPLLPLVPALAVAGRRTLPAAPRYDLRERRIPGSGPPGSGVPES
ncbi:hypothetical protein [Nonomuraea sp. NPDC050783]|uniref:hypothetical protein n=1 Tax=Nonomuraea sp. NPDC050783 TaxID=3154634 RepID=UPI003465E4E5